MRKLLQKQMQSLRRAKQLSQAASGTSTDDFGSNLLDRQDVGQDERVMPQIIIQQMMPSGTAALPNNDQISEELKRIDADVKQGLLDKTGDGANANIIKLGEQIKAVAEGIRHMSNTLGGNVAARSQARSIEYDDERLSAIRMQGDKYIPGVKEGFGLNPGGKLSNLKNLLSGTPLKDLKLEDIDDRSLFGGAIKRRMAEKQYAEDQLSMAKTAKGAILANIKKKAEYQDESGQFSEEIFKQKKIEQFKQQNKLRGEIGQTMEQIDRLKHDEGYTDEQIKKTGLYKTLQQQEKELSKLDPDRFGREVKEAKKKDIEKQKNEAAAKATSQSIESIISTPSVDDSTLASSDPALNISEKESENALVVSKQIELLVKIEENTRPIKELSATIKSAMASSGSISSAAGADDSSGTGSAVAAGAGIGSKLKSLGKGALSLAKKGARFVKPIAIPAAIAYGTMNAVDYAAGAVGVGQNIEIDETQDEANWQKMSTSQKIGSGLARGIENVGSFLGLDNIMRSAEASRISKETEMLKGESDGHESKQVTESDITFNEVAFAEADPDNYQKFIEFKEQRTKEIFDEISSKRSPARDAQTANRIKRADQNLAQKKATQEAILKFKKEIESAKAGSIQTYNYNTGSNDQVVSDRAIDTNEESLDTGNLIQSANMQKSNRINSNSLAPSTDIGSKVYQQSDELKAAEKIGNQQPSTNIVNAPTTNVSQTTQNISRPPARNTDSTYREYSRSRFDF